MDRFWHIAKIVVFTILLLIMAIVVALQLPPVQTLIIRKVTGVLEENFDAKISIGKIGFKPISTIIIKDVVVQDTAPYDSTSYETFASIGVLSVRFSPFSLASPGHSDIRLKNVKVKDGVFNFVIEGGEYNSNLQRIFRIPGDKEPKPMPDKDIFFIKHIDIDNFCFRMKNYVTEMHDFPDKCVNWGDLDVNHANIKARNFKIGRGLFSGRVDQMSFMEKCGWNVTDLKGEAVVGKGDVSVKNFHLEDSEGSCADLDFEMIGKTPDYQDFVNKVVMVAEIKDSRWCLKTLARVIPPLNPDDRTYVKLHGHYRGTVADMSGTDLRADVENSSIGFTLNGGMSGLPDIQNTYYHADISSFTAKTSDLSKLLQAISGRKDIDLSKLGKDKIFNIDISANGPMNGLKVNSGIRMGDEGSVTLSASVNNVLDRRKAMAFNGRISSDKLNLETLLGNKMLGETSMSTIFDLSLPHKNNPFEAHLDSLKITSATFNGHAYSGIEGKASLIGKDISADLKSSDPAFYSDITVWSDSQAYNATILLRNADLNEMNFDKRGVSVVSADIFATLDKDLQNMQGKANISNIVMINDEGASGLKFISVNAVKNDGDYDISLDSDIMTGHFFGNKQRLDASFHAMDMTSLLNYALPGLYLEEGSNVKLMRDSTGYLKGEVHSKRLAYKDNFIKDINLTARGKIDSIAADLTSSRIQAFGFVLDNDKFHLARHDSLATVNYTFNNETGDIQYGDINGGAIFGKGDGVKVIIDDSKIGINHKTWVMPASSISINGKEIIANNFSASCGTAFIKLDGEMSSEKEARLSADIKNINLKAVNNFIKDNNFHLNGTLNAKGAILSPVTDDFPMILADLTTDSLSIGGVYLDRLKAVSKYDRNSNGFIIKLTDSLSNNQILKVDAIYKPKQKVFNSGIVMSEFPFGWVKAFVPTLFSELEGKASGKCAFIIDEDGPRVKSNGNIKIDDGLLTVAFTHVPYNIDGNISVNDNGIQIGKMSVTDRFGSNAMIGGGLKWKRLKDMEMDLHMRVDNIEALNIPSNSKDAIIYGHVFGTGNVDITGPFTNLLMSVDARTVGKSDIHIVISGDMDSSRGNLLKMVNPYEIDIDKYEAVARKFSKANVKEDSNFNMKLHTVGDPQLQIYLDMGGGGFAAGMEGNGNGVIDMGIGDKYNGFTIFGDYTLAEGNFDANANNIVHRNFAIHEGSNIKFGGDIFESDINLKATYETKASISTLIADTSSVSTRRPILCGITINDKLSNPKVGFSIDIPDLSPSVKSKVQSALSTEDKVQRQFLSLLLSNNFLPDESSGIVNTSSLLYSNVSEMMANQINNIFSKLDIPLDLGLNYQPTERGDNIFDVALSTQLWNNRIIIGGSIGNRTGSSSKNESLAGDLDVQLKVNKSGSFRVKAFSHSADQYSNALDNSQRNGVGLSWQQEFNRFVDWVKQLFYKKEKREELAAKEVEDYKFVQKFIIDE